jgi:nitrate reductase cytochrome c-type subunit
LAAKYPRGFYQSYSEDAYELCLNCHDADRFNLPRTLTATNFRNANLNLHYRHVHKKKGRNCLACHDPHGSRQAHTIVSAFHFGARDLTINYTATASGGTCAPACHVQAYYDRLQPADNRFRTTHRLGQDATAKELLDQPGAHKKVAPKAKKKVKKVKDK